ncbi:hypothetical protein VTO73DRAFT_13971 [Trametes versicolor]
MCVYVRNSRGTAAITSPLLDPGDVISKRTSTHIGDLHAPSPSPKRVKHEHSIQKARTPPAPGPCTLPPMKSANFWYPDGNIVIKADTAYYKLHSMRLARYCVYFKKLFADHTDDYEDRCAKVEGFPVYHIPTNLDSDEFEKLLAVLETPLRAAHSLSCDVVLRLARKRLCVIWHPPKVSPRPATKIGPVPSFLSADTAAMHTYHGAVFIILFARQYGMPELLKRAFYELLASAGFWAALTADRKHIRLAENDLLRLYNVRHVLQRRWREAVVLAPHMDEKSVSTCRGTGMGDPLRYNTSNGLTKEQKEAWCRVCRKGWTEMLLAKRREWWVFVEQIGPPRFRTDEGSAPRKREGIERRVADEFARDGAVEP